MPGSGPALGKHNGRAGPRPHTFRPPRAGPWEEPRCRTAWGRRAGGLAPPVQVSAVGHTGVHMRFEESALQRPPPTWGSRREGLQTALV